MGQRNKKMTLFQLIALSIAFYGSIRNVPTVASAGWQSIFFIVGAGVLFAIPISLIAAELATGWPKEGGSQVWVDVALGDKWSFVTSWLLWVQMFFGMVMVASAFSTMLAYVINKPQLAENNVYVAISIICAYWVITLINVKTDLGKYLSSIGSVIGIYIPFILMVLLGLWWSFKHGIVNLGSLTWQSAIPDLTSTSKLSFFAGIIFIFAGLEISSVHANDIDNPKKNYPIAVISSVAAMIIFNLVAGLTEANAIPNDEIQLATVIQPFAVYFKEIGIPWATNIVAAMIAVGILAQLSAWVLGPSKAMIKVADQGNLPPVFQKRNKNNIPVTFVYIQAIIISIVALLYIVVPAINTGFFMILILTTILYCIVYLFIITAGIVLRYKKPEVKRAFTIPGKHNIGMWITSIIAYIGVILTVVVSFIPSDDIPQKDHLGYVVFLLVGTLFWFVIPLIIYKFKKPSWVKNIPEDKNENTSSITDTMNKNITSSTNKLKS